MLTFEGNTIWTVSTSMLFAQVGSSVLIELRKIAGSAKCIRGGGWPGYDSIVQSNLSLRPPDKSDHLKIADTQFQSLHFADSNVRTEFLKMRPPEKCELRTPKVGPKRRFNLRKATTNVKLSEKHFFVCLNFPSEALRTSDHRVCKLHLSWSLPVTPPLTCGSHPSLMSWRAGACVQLHIEKF